MIIDTSALVAVFIQEDGWVELTNALRNERGHLPAPALLEFLSVVRGPRFRMGDSAVPFLDRLTRVGHEVVAWTPAHAIVAADAHLAYGKGNGKGGMLNIVDLMVYAVARHDAQPLLFTGRDFTTTDVSIHPASRVG